MGFGYFWADAASKICSPDTCMKLLPVSHIFSSKYTINAFRQVKKHCCACNYY